MVELDAEPRLGATSKSALSQILGGWRFADPGGRPPGLPPRARGRARGR